MEKKLFSKVDLNILFGITNMAIPLPSQTNTSNFLLEYELKFFFFLISEIVWQNMNGY